MAETMPLKSAIPKRSRAAERQAIFAELPVLARRARDAGLPSVALVLDLAAAMEGDDLPTRYSDAPRQQVVVGLQPQKKPSLRPK